MKDRLKVGNRVSCVVEGIFPNFLSLSFRSAGVTYRGVLFNETCSTVKRVIPENYFKEKKVLQQETTDSLYNEATNRELDTNSKGLRSKKSKQSCLVLDDYVFESDNSIGISPIDSLCGLVESIDSNICRTTMVEKSTQAKTDADSNGVSPKEIAADKKSSEIINDNKTNSNQQNKPASKRAESKIKLTFKNQAVKTESKVSLEDSKLTVAVSQGKEREVCPTQRVKKRKLSDTSETSVQKPTNVEIKKEGETLKQSGTPSQKRLRQEDSTDSVIPSQEAVKKRKKRRGITYVKNQKRRKEILAAKKKAAPSPETPVVATDVIPIVRIEKKKMIKKKAPVKRIDPIALALKNIKNRESMRRRQRLNMMTRRSLSTSPNDLLRRAENKHVKRPVVKKKNIVVRRNSQSSDVNETLTSEKKTDLPCEKTLSETESVIETQPTATKRSKRLHLKQKPETKEFEESSRASRQNRRFKKLELAVLHRDDIVVGLRKKVKQTNDDKNTKQNEDNQYPNNPVVRIIKNPKAEKRAGDSGGFSAATPELSNKSQEIDLTCHEKVASPNDTIVVTPHPAQQRKNRRKPLHVFKSLPNPVTDPLGFKTGELNINDYKDLKDYYSDPDIPIATKNKTNIKSSKTMSVSETQLSPKRVLGNSESDIFTNDISSSERPYKITISRMNRPTLIPRRFLDNRFAPSYQTFIQQPVKPSPLKHLQKPGAMVSRKIDIDSPPRSSSSSPSSSTVTSPNDDDEVEKMLGDVTEDDSVKVKKLLEKSTENRNTNCEKKVVPPVKTKKRKRAAIFDFQETLKPLTRSNDDIRLGDIVWGRVFGYGWWPGQVLSNVHDADSSDVRRVFCTWMGSNTNSTMSVTDLELFLPTFEKRFEVRKTSATYTKAVIEAQQTCSLKYGLK